MKKKCKTKKKKVSYQDGGEINALTGLIGTGLSVALPGVGMVAAPLLEAFGNKLTQDMAQNKILQDHYNSLSAGTNPYGNYKDGGTIHIKKSKKGTFTRAAKERGMGVQEFAAKVKANPENYSAAMRKKANFARNAKKFKHEDGGEIQGGFEDLLMYGGGSHNQGGIGVSSTGIPSEFAEAEVEGGESVYRIGNKAFVFSKSLKV